MIIIPSMESLNNPQIANLVKKPNLCCLVTATALCSKSVIKGLAFFLKEPENDY